MQQTFMVTITTDPDIARLYPNYRFNFHSQYEFIRHIVEEIRAIQDDGSFGYTITVKRLEDVMVSDVPC